MSLLSMNLPAATADELSKKLKEEVIPAIAKALVDEVIPAIRESAKGLHVEFHFSVDITSTKPGA